MSKFLLAIACMFYAFTAIGQINFNELPDDSSIVPRNLITNEGVVKISGYIKRSTGAFNKIKIKEYRNNVPADSFFTRLSFKQNIAEFSFSMNIKAELAEYNFEVYAVGGSHNSLLKTVSGITAGDAFIIQGQSNAAAGEIYGSSNAENQSEFIRVWGSGNTNGYTPKWFIANGDIWDWGGDGNAGQWGLRLARLIQDTYKIPVAIFNGANSGEPINWFQRNNTDSVDQTTNYGRLLKRITETGFQNNIRAIFWYQGEADSYADNSINTYKNSFYNLYNGWQKDYTGFQHLYIIQIKQGCGQPLPAVNKIQEAQRELAMEIANTSIYATNGTEHAGDTCHYFYDNGYRVTAEHLFPLVNRDIYKAPDTLVNIESPQVTHAVQTGKKEIALYFKNKNDSYVWEPGTENDFVLDDSDNKIKSGEINDSILVLTSKKPLKNIHYVSFRGHAIGGSPCVRNISGEGIVGFYEMPVNLSISSNNVAQTASKNQHMIIAPNPAHDKMLLQYQLLKPSDVLISITDVTGRVAQLIYTGKQFKGSNSVSINVNQLSAGIYFLQLKAGAEVYTGKFVKE
ncbi:MAG: T9SS type A sorting domain-containing protein [Parafilimonas sp.]|nr:T9SS type A sorting domain-containing protein [Parafilimonas sp.]